MGEVAKLFEGLEIPGTELGHKTMVRALLDAIEGGASMNAAAAQVGIARRTLYNWFSHPEFKHAVEVARGRSKAAKERAVHVAGTVGHTTRERRIRYAAPDGAVDVSVESLVPVEMEEIIRELPPDWKASVAALRALYPEEWGSIRRLEVASIGVAKQIDEAGAPERPDSPLKQIQMILDGDTWRPPEGEDE